MSEAIRTRFQAILAREMAKPLPPPCPPVNTRWHYRKKKRRKPDPAEIRTKALGRAVESPRLSPMQRRILDQFTPIGPLVGPGVVGPRKTSIGVG